MIGYKKRRKIQNKHFLLFFVLVFIGMGWYYWYQYSIKNDAFNFEDFKVISLNNPDLKNTKKSVFNELRLLDRATGSKSWPIPELKENKNRGNPFAKKTTK